jgi:hypothetical protein
MAINVTKFMVTVETKNYPVVTIRPTIQRYARIRKKMNASEIAQCLSCYAIVTLEKNNGTKVRLTADNFKEVLRSYTAQLNDIEINKGIAEDERNNTARVEKIKEETVTTTTSSKKAAVVEQPVEETPTVTEPTGEQNEEFIQEDPEDEDKFSDAPYYEGDDE